MSNESIEAAPVEIVGEPPPTEERRAKNGWRIGNRKKNGGLPGTGTKKGTERNDIKKTYPAEALAEAALARITSGKPIRTTIPYITEGDARLLERIAAMKKEEFDAHLSAELADIASLAAVRMKEKLAKDEFKASELGFALAVATDKRGAIEGRNALTNASINIQVNNFGASSKQSILDALEGKIKPATPEPPKEI